MTTCELCNCPLTRLKTANKKLEARTLCARCSEVVVPTPTVPTIVPMKKVRTKEPAVYRAPQGPRSSTATVLAIDAFMRGRGKSRNG